MSYWTVKKNIGKVIDHVTGCGKRQTAKSLFGKFVERFMGFMIGV